MARKRNRLRVVTLAGAAVVVAALGTVTYNASAAEQRPQAGAEFTSASVPAAIRPPAGSRFLGTAKVVKGTQTYTCTGGVFTGASVPEAQLAGTIGKVHHYKGPSWTVERDGSTVTATKIGEATKTGTIPQLLLEINGHTGPNGKLTNAKYIQRLQTTGGTAPAGTCTDGETKAAAYGATYVFWS
ncbi:MULTISPECIES: DUF3455 domain-containing protein [Actinoplanes]|uniref:DUF3455 domain-containing protein n=1 Tax=Actinoplanes TaxID=1865 RepID=UPI0005F2EEC0|nr:MULTISPECIES: DUF3455 domain-containing protein [Actinoplanes]GLY08409.1 hypothetical protein Acsp01_87880 [Actinoplanes sp. NBRC 101535]